MGKLLVTVFALFISVVILVLYCALVIAGRSDEYNNKGDNGK